MSRSYQSKMDLGSHSALKTSAIESSENPKGVDYFVGDVHGELEELEDCLSQLGFNKRTDRLFATGDLIDRGSDSLACLRLVREPWFHAVRGNHEEIFREVLECRDPVKKCQITLLHTQNGGEWAVGMTPETAEECIALINQLPLRRTIQLKDKTIGLVHAGWRWDWDGSPISDTHELLQIEYATWSRLSEPDAVDTVPGVDAVVAGHQNTTDVVTRGNQIWIDTLLNGGRLSILTADEILELIANATDG